MVDSPSLLLFLLLLTQLTHSSPLSLLHLLLSSPPLLPRPALQPRSLSLLSLLGFSRSPLPSFFPFHFFCHHGFCSLFLAASLSLRQLVLLSIFSWTWLPSWSFFLSSSLLASPGPSCPVDKRASKTNKQQHSGSATQRPLQNRHKVRKRTSLLPSLGLHLIYTSPTLSLLPYRIAPRLG